VMTLPSLVRLMLISPMMLPWLSRVIKFSPYVG
jgi:hypothetical protein